MMELLVRPGIKKVKTLLEEIHRFESSSADFCESWTSNHLDDAYEQSEEAFKALDHIQNELLRIRDDNKKDNNWQSSPLKQALDLVVGRIAINISEVEKMHLKLQLPVVVTYKRLCRCKI